jgi:hypothetical protein
LDNVASFPKNFEQIARVLCDTALNDARSHLHPLIRTIELDRLDGRTEFVREVRFAIERRIARQLAVWDPSVQAVFRFDESRVVGNTLWDGTVHLLVKVPRLSTTMQTVGKELNLSLVKYLKQLGWSRFRNSQSMLDIQQVTPNELRRRVSYGAMFCAVYSVPIKVWPQNEHAR